MRYAVIRTIQSPTAGAVRTARLVLADVPDKTSVTDVAAALTEAGRAADYAEAGVPFGNHEIRAEGRTGWPKGIAEIDTAPVITWARLVQPPLPNEGRRVTLRLTPPEHSAFTLASQRAGVSLQTWCLEALEAAARASPASARGRRLGAALRSDPRLAGDTDAAVSAAYDDADRAAAQRAARTASTRAARSAASS